MQFLAHIRSHSSIIPTIIIPNEDSNSPVKLRSSGIGELDCRKSNENLNQTAGKFKINS
jgi:hypothetical protein